MILGKVVTLLMVNRGRGRGEGDTTFSRRLNTAQLNASLSQHHLLTSPYADSLRSFAGQYILSHTECDSGIRKAHVEARSDNKRPFSAYSAYRSRCTTASSRAGFDLPLHITVVVISSKVVA